MFSSIFYSTAIESLEVIYSLEPILSFSSISIFSYS